MEQRRASNQSIVRGRVGRVVAISPFVFQWLKKKISPFSESQKRQRTRIPIHREGVMLPVRVQHSLGSWDPNRWMLWDQRTEPKDALGWIPCGGRGIKLLQKIQAVWQGSDYTSWETCSMRSNCYSRQSSCSLENSGLPWVAWRKAGSTFTYLVGCLFLCSTNTYSISKCRYL